MWPEQNAAVVQKVEEIITNYQDKLNEEGGFEDDLIKIARYSKVVKNPESNVKHEHSYYIILKSGDRELSTINYFPSRLEILPTRKIYGKVQITYAMRNPESVEKDWNRCNNFFQAALGAKDQEEFIDHFSKLVHFLGNLLPLKLGSAGVAEWIFEAVGREKGHSFELDFQKAGKIGWDFNALVTPSPDEYKQWLKNALISKESKEESPGKSPSPQATNLVKPLKSAEQSASV